MTRYLVMVNDDSVFGRCNEPCIMSGVQPPHGMIDDLETALELTALYDNCMIIAFEPNNANSQLKIQLRLTPAEQQSYDWLVRQGGLVEMAAADEYASNWWGLERKLWIRRVVPEGCSRMHWSTCMED